MSFSDFGKCGIGKQAFSSEKTVTDYSKCHLHWLNGDAAKVALRTMRTHQSSPTKREQARIESFELKARNGQIDG